jgi:hypothetical protein
MYDVLITNLINAYCVLFLVSDIFYLHREYKARDSQQCASLEGSVLSFVGCILATIVALFTEAWIGVGAEVFMTFAAFMALYWKARWLHKKFRLTAKGWVKR